MTNGNVYHVGDEHEEEFLKKHERLIAFFYAPWCDKREGAGDGMGCESRRGSGGREGCRACVRETE